MSARRSRISCTLRENYVLLGVEQIVSIISLAVSLANFALLVVLLLRPAPVPPKLPRIPVNSPVPPVTAKPRRPQPAPVTPPETFEPVLRPVRPAKPVESVVLPDCRSCDSWLLSQDIVNATIEGDQTIFQVVCSSCGVEQKIPVRT